jgi:DNA-binding CsgD family transcriptional regulator
MLTAREIDIVYLVSQGCRYATIRADRKLSVGTAAAAVTRAAELGMLRSAPKDQAIRIES